MISQIASFFFSCSKKHHSIRLQCDIKNSIAMLNASVFALITSRRFSKLPLEKSKKV